MSVLHLCIVLLGLAATCPALAQDGLIDRANRMEAASERLLRALTWEKASDTLREVVDAIAASSVSHKDVPLDRAYEYAIQRNSGWRRLHFSTWNDGWRVTTEPYGRGDFGFRNCDPGDPRACPSDPKLDDDGIFRLGGSMWIIGTRDVRDNACTATELYHLYYEYEHGATRALEGNKCGVAGPVWRRPRLFDGEPLPE